MSSFRSYDHIFNKTTWKFCQTQKIGHQKPRRIWTAQQIAHLVWISLIIFFKKGGAKIYLDESDSLSWTWKFNLSPGRLQLLQWTKISTNRPFFAICLVYMQRRKFLQAEWAGLEGERLALYKWHLNYAHLGIVDN